MSSVLSGLGQPEQVKIKSLVPVPKFSSENPYFQNPAHTWGFLRPEYRPKLTGQDYLMACTWEINRWDWLGARFWKEAMLAGVRATCTLSIKLQIAAQIKGEKNEKAV